MLLAIFEDLKPWSIWCSPLVPRCSSWSSYYDEAYEKIEDLNVHVMAGNVATREGFEDLCDWEADLYDVTSVADYLFHASPDWPWHSGLQTIFDCSMSNHTCNVKIIADGGLRIAETLLRPLLLVQISSWSGRYYLEH